VTMKGPRHPSHHCKSCGQITLNKAVREDALELISKPCDSYDLARYCGPVRENSPECIEKCG
jgi:hypothetical protein